MITHKHMPLTDLTRSSTMYFEFLRAATTICQVAILRNPFDIQDGIYIVGEDSSVSFTIGFIEGFIEKVEMKVKRKRFKRGSTHLAEQRANFRDEWIKKALGDIKYVKTPTHPDLPQLIDEYIKNCSLRNLKKFRGK